MNFAQLRAFHAVAEHGSFSRAAGALSVTQPAVSAQVKGLEESYGVTLFERHARGISLTEPGRRLFDVTRRLFQLEDEADETLRSEHEKPPELFRLGSDAPYSLSPLLSGYCQAHPGTQVSHVMGTAEELQQEIVNERLDVAVVVRVQDDPRLLITRFAAHRIVVVVPKDHPWAGRADVGLEELDGVGMVLRDPRHSLTNQTFEAALRRRHVKPDVIMRVDSRENLREGVSAGVGIGLTTDADAATDFRIKGVPLSDPGMFITDYVICLRRRRGVRTIADFIALADELVRSGAIQAPA